ncbi:cytochrome b [Oceanospirillum beijerinckii]|uniref:cytochrome b n=1 Tax=Oceanospirillum beijerinckii TaxID=64976 RepID=UPI00041E6AD4|nr:cytochrome b [Oceanospirillum beijerinckii]
MSHSHSLRAEDDINSPTVSPVLDRLTIALHWLVGWSIIGLLALGIYMEENNAYHLYGLHKSLGALIFIVIVIRAWRRVRQGWPKPVNEYTRMEQRLSKITHYVLLIGSVLIPLSGLVMTIAGGRGLEVFGLEVIGANIDPANPDKPLPLVAPLAGIAHQMHGMVSNLVIVALVLHIIGALKHHMIDKDNTLKRMLGR